MISGHLQAIRKYLFSLALAGSLVACVGPEGQFEYHMLVYKDQIEREARGDPALPAWGTWNRHWASCFRAQRNRRTDQHPEVGKALIKEVIRIRQERGLPPIKE